MPKRIRKSSSQGPSNNQKRTNYLEWDDYFMAVAFLSAKRSKDPSSQVGACIANPEKKIVGVGYNGMPTGCSDDDYPWGKNSSEKLENKYLYVCHAAMNAIINKNCCDLKNCTLYIVLFPCNDCAKLIIQSGIKEVVYYSDKYAQDNEHKAAKRMFESVGIQVRKYTPKETKIIINFNEIDWNRMETESTTED